MVAISSFCVMQLSQIFHFSLGIWYSHILRGGGGGGLSQPPMISKTVDSTNFSFSRLLGLSVSVKKLVELMT